MSTGASESERTVSARSLAGTSAIPASCTCTSIASRADTSRSVLCIVRLPPSVASSSTPVSAGIPGRAETPRWIVWSASDSTSRSHRNFTCPPPRTASALLLSPTRSGRGCGKAHNRGRTRAYRLPRTWGSGGENGEVQGRPRSLPERSPRLSTPRPPSRGGAPRVGADQAGQVLDLAIDGLAVAHLLLDLVDAVERGRVVPLEQLADLDQRHTRALADEVHRHVASRRERPGAALRGEVADRQGKVPGGLVEDHAGRDLGLRLREQILEGVLGEVAGDRLAGEVGPRDHSDERALELADVLVEPRGDELDHVVGDMGRFPARLQLEDRDPGLEVRRLHVDAQPQAEPALEALLHPEFLGRAVRGDHDLALFLVERVERVEELGLRLLALGQELDVVDEQDVHVAVAGGELVALAVADVLGGSEDLEHALVQAPRTDLREPHREGALGQLDLGPFQHPVPRALAREFGGCDDHSYPRGLSTIVDNARGSWWSRRGR